MNCPLEYQVHCGTYMLKGETHFWWEGAQKIIASHEESIIWYEFKEAYLRKYYLITTRMKLHAAFLELKESDKSVEDYDLEFNRLARFSLEFVSTKELKAERFIADLREDIKGYVASQASTDYTEAFKMATLIDMPCIDKLQSGSAKTPHTTAQGKKINWNLPRTSRPHRGGIINQGRASVQNKNPCPKCQRSHLRECRQGTDVCYSCGQTGHFVANYPQRRDHTTNRPAIKNLLGFLS